MTKSEFIKIVSEYVGKITTKEEYNECVVFANKNELLDKTELKKVMCEIALSDDGKRIFAEEWTHSIIGGFVTTASVEVLREFLEKFNFQKKGKPHLQQMIMDLGE